MTRITRPTSTVETSTPRRVVARARRAIVGDTTAITPAPKIAADAKHCDSHPEGPGMISTGITP